MGDPMAQPMDSDTRQKTKFVPQRVVLWVDFAEVVPKKKKGWNCCQYFVLLDHSQRSRNGYASLCMAFTHVCNSRPPQNKTQKALQLPERECYWHWFSGPSRRDPIYSPDFQSPGCNASLLSSTSPIPPCLSTSVVNISYAIFYGCFVTMEIAGREIRYWILFNLCRCIGDTCPE